MSIRVCIIGSYFATNFLYTQFDTVCILLTYAVYIQFGYTEKGINSIYHNCRIKVEVFWALIGEQGFATLKQSLKM